MFAASACAPVNPSAADLVGRWRAVWTCGTETLELKADHSYAYTVAFAAGGAASDSGRWRVVPKSERLSGARVVLENALQGCSDLGEKAAHPERANRELETVWEWGRTVLSFHPDIPGFTRD